MRGRLRRRYASERRFRLLGLFAVLLSAGFLAFLLFTMAFNGFRGFTLVTVEVPVDFLKVLAKAGDHVVEDRHLGAAANKFVGKIRANETGPTGNQNVRSE